MCKALISLRDCKLPPVKHNGHIVLGSVRADVMCNIKEEEVPCLLAVWPSSCGSAFFLVDRRKQRLHHIKTISEVTSAIPHEVSSRDAK